MVFFIITTLCFLLLCSLFDFGLEMDEAEEVFVAQSPCAQFGAGDTDELVV